MDIDYEFSAAEILAELSEETLRKVYEEFKEQYAYLKRNGGAELIHAVAIEYARNAYEFVYGSLDEEE